MRIRSSVTAAAFVAYLTMTVQSAHAAPCLMVTITGAMGGPPNFNGLAGPGTLVRYGDESNGCNAVKLQFDAGRATSIRLQQLGIPAGQLNAVFFTHMHSDHADGFADIVQLRWHYASKAPKLDMVCSADAKSPLGHIMSCSKYAAHIGDAFLQSGEIEQRVSEDKNRPAGGPAELINEITFEPRNEPQLVWSSRDVRVSAIRSTHIPGHASYRVDTPAGSVVIGGDAGNDTFAPPRVSSTSEQVEALAKGVDVVVHSAIHPVMAPDKGSGMPAPFYFRQSTSADLGAMAKRVGAKHLMLTHMIPPVGAEFQGAYKIPGGALSEADYSKSVEESGFTGVTTVGKDLVTIRLPAKAN